MIREKNEKSFSPSRARKIAWWIQDKPQTIFRERQLRRGNRFCSQLRVFCPIPQFCAGAVIWNRTSQKTSHPCRDFFRFRHIFRSRAGPPRSAEKCHLKNRRNPLKKHSLCLRNVFFRFFLTFFSILGVFLLDIARNEVILKLTFNLNLRRSVL